MYLLINNEFLTDFSKCELNNHNNLFVNLLGSVKGKTKGKKNIERETLQTQWKASVLMVKHSRTPHFKLHT